MSYTSDHLENSSVVFKFSKAPHSWLHKMNSGSGLKRETWRPAILRPLSHNPHPQHGSMFSVIQCVLGAILLLIDIFGLVIGTYKIDSLSLVGAGLWSGLLFTITGVSGILTVTSDEVSNPVGIWFLSRAFFGLNYASALLGFILCAFCVGMHLTGTGLSADITKLTAFNFIRASEFCIYLIEGIIATLFIATRQLRKTVIQVQYVRSRSVVTPPDVSIA